VRGVATSYAAISIVNALPLGVGAAVGIAWPVRTVASLVPPRARGARIHVEPWAAATRVVLASARTALARFAPRSKESLRLLVRSAIPVARGLKSSSAVATSVLRATARAVGRQPRPAEIARLAAQVGRATGVSATGAYDDALAGLVAGGVITDNRLDRELGRFKVARDLGVALWVPGRRHPPSPTVLGRFRRERAAARKAVDAVLAGDWAQAMHENSALVERVMGYRYGPLHDAVRAAGAVASGVSGLGPAFVALAARDRLPRVVRALPRRGHRRSVELLDPAGANGVASR
jgi:shikimate kinase